MAIDQTPSLLNSLKEQLSTNYAEEFTRSNFMAEVPSELDGTNWIDPLDPRLIAIFKEQTPYEEYKYSSESITTLSYQFYSTTSLWWLILMFNGFLHPHDIPPGYALKIPSSAFILKRMKTPVKDSIKGKIVSF